MAQNDRTTGLVGNAGMKVPVRACATAAVTLSGEQTIDGVALVTDDRVLLTAQTSSVDNGIYVVDTGTWERAKDADGAYDFVKGSMIKVNSGTSNSGVWQCTTADPITVGTSALTFTLTSFIATITAYALTLLAAATAAATRILLGINSQALWCGTATGTANALVLTPAPAAESLAAGLTLVFKSGAAPNSAATTIAVSGLAATAAQSNGSAMVGAEIQASKWYRATYDGAAFQVERIGPALLLDHFAAKGDLVAGTADGAVGIKSAGADNTLLGYDSTQTTGLRTFTLAGTLSAAGGVLTGAVATQAEAESAASLVTAVTPGRQQYHPSAAKFWHRTTYAAGSPTLQASFNVSSLSDTGVGALTVNFTTAFSSANYASFATSELSASSSDAYDESFTHTTGSVVQRHFEGAALADPTSTQGVGFGDQ